VQSPGPAAPQSPLLPHVAVEHCPGVPLPLHVCGPAEQSLFEKHVAVEHVPGITPLQLPEGQSPFVKQLQ
jgi:hypothetical protein